MATKQTETVVKKEPFMLGYSLEPFEGSKCEDPYYIRLGVKQLEDGSVVPDESDLVDLNELIQTYRDQCGMEMAKQLIRTGQVDPNHFADPGNVNFDDSNIPVGRQAIDNAVIQATSQVDRLKALFGIPQNADLTEEQVNQLIASYVSKNQDKFVQASAPAAAEEPKE